MHSSAGVLLSVFIFRLSVCGKIITMKKTSKFLLLLLLIHTLSLASPAKTTPGKVMKVSLPQLASQASSDRVSRIVRMLLT